VKLIGSEAFIGSSVRSFALPASVEVIGPRAFAKCESLREFAVPSDSALLEIGDFGFSGSGVEVFTFEGSTKLETVGEFAFAGTRLYEFILPSSVETLGVGAFSGTENLFSFTFADDSDISEISDSTFSNSALQQISLPARVTKISDFAFARARFLSSVNLPPSLVSLGDSSFSGTAITSLILPASVATIGESAFRRSRSLSTLTFSPRNSRLHLSRFAFFESGIRSVALPPSVTFDSSAFGPLPLAAPNFEIANDVLVRAIGQTPQQIPPGVTEIGASAFVSFAGPIDLPDSLLRISESAFAGSFITTITIPATVKLIATSAFRGSRLSQVTFAPGSALERIEGFAFSDTALSTITLPDNLEFVDGSAFEQLQEIAVPNNRFFIVDGRSLLRTDRPNLVKGFGYDPMFKIPEQVEEVGPYALSGLRTVTRVVVPPGLRQLGAFAFRGTAIRLLSLPDAIAADPGAFEGIQASPWKSDASGQAPLRYRVRDAIGYDGPAREILYDLAEPILIRCFARARVIVIPRDVVKIGAWAFSGVETVRHVEPEPGSQLEVIEEGAFAGSGVLSITIPRSIKRIDAEAIPVSCTVELEIGPRSRAAEVEFERWLHFRRAGSNRAFPLP
jgi:hypothetical protein